MACFEALTRRLARKEKLTIVAFGSSTTEGIGASSPTASYPAVLQTILAEKLGLGLGFVVVLNRGVGGEEAHGMLERIERDALALAPDLVIWQTGSNDAMMAAPIERFADDTRAAMLKLKAAKIDAMLMEPQWSPVLEQTPNSKAYRDAVKDVGVELDIPVLLRRELMLQWMAEGRATQRELIGPDGIHMVDRSYALLAEAVASQILENICPSLS